MSQANAIAYKLKLARTEHGFSIRQLAKETGLSPTTISLAEKGADIRISTLLTLCDPLGIEIRMQLDC